MEEAEGEKEGRQEGEPHLSNRQASFAVWLIHQFHWANENEGTRKIVYSMLSIYRRYIL